MRLQEARELERLNRSSRRGHAVLVKLISSRAKLGSEMKSKCQEVNRLEEGLEAAKLLSRQLEEKLLQLVEGVCNPSNQRRRMKADDVSKEMNRLFMKVKLIEEQNIRLSSKVTDIRNRQPHLHHHHHHQQYQHHCHHPPQQVKLLDKDSSLLSTSPLLRPSSATASNLDPNASLALRSPLHQQPLQGPYLSSTAIQILQLREADKAVQKNPQQAQSGQVHSIPAYSLISCNNAAPPSLRETGKSPARSDARSTLTPSSVLQVRGSPSRDQPSKVINVNIVAGGRLNIAKESETTHFKVADEDNSNRQKQLRLPAATASIASTNPLRWPNSEISPINAALHFQHSEGQAASLQQQKQQHLQSQKPGRFLSARSAAAVPLVSSPSVGLQSRTQKGNQILTTFKPSATQSSTTSSWGAHPLSYIATARVLLLSFFSPLISSASSFHDPHFLMANRLPLLEEHGLRDLFCGPPSIFPLRGDKTLCTLELLFACKCVICRACEVRMLLFCSSFGRSVPNLLFYLCLFTNRFILRTFLVHFVRCYTLWLLLLLLLAMRWCKILLFILLVRACTASNTAAVLDGGNEDDDDDDDDDDVNQGDYTEFITINIFPT